MDEKKRPVERQIFCLRSRRAGGEKDTVAEMIDKSGFHVLNYVKKEDYTGSMEGMRYMLRKKETEGEVRLEVILWPEPYNFIRTPESRKQREYFPFSEEGLEEAVDWMNEQYERQGGLWRTGR